MPFPKSREGHAGHPYFEIEDGSGYEIETQDTWWGIRCTNMHPDRFIGLLSFMRTSKAIVKATIDGIERAFSLIRLSCITPPLVDDATGDHRFSLYIYVARRNEVDRDQTLNFSEQGRVELSMVLGVDLPTTNRQGDSHAH